MSDQCVVLYLCKKTLLSGFSSSYLGLDVPGNSLQYTEDHGLSLGLSGWVKNTRQGTVIGQIQGPRDKVNDMKLWLKSVGSPSSRIDRAVFSNERDICKLEIHGFSTRY